METKNNYVKKRRWKYFFQQKAVEIGRIILMLGCFGALLFISYFISDLINAEQVCTTSLLFSLTFCKISVGFLFLLGLCLLGLIIYAILCKIVEWIKSNMQIAENKATKDWKKENGKN